MLTKSMHIALDDLRLERLFVAYPGAEAYPLHERVETLPIAKMTKKLQALR